MGRYEENRIIVEIYETETDQVVENMAYGILDKEISEKRKRQCARLIEVSKSVIRQAFDRFKPDEIAVTWTGGKDSGLSLWIIKQVCEERNMKFPKTLLIGEGDEFQEIEGFH